MLNESLTFVLTTWPCNITAGLIIFIDISSVDLLHKVYCHFVFAQACLISIVTKDVLD